MLNQWFVEIMENIQQRILIFKNNNLDIKLYIEYKSEKLISKQKLISNTFDKYFEELENNLNAKLLDETIASRRFKNKLSKPEQEQIIKIFDLHDLDEVVLNCDKPYFLNLLYFIDSLNNIKYLINETYGHSETKYNYDNYKTKTDRLKEQGEVFDKPLDIKEANLHRGIIDEYKADDVIGSLMIKSLEFSPPINMFDDSETALLQNNKNFKKQFSKINFTKSDLFRGFASKIFWNYAHKNYDKYKAYIASNNIQAKKYSDNKQNYKDYRTPIELIKKVDIENAIKEVFNTIFRDEIIKQIRTSKEEPKILTIYDFIEIPTIKSIKQLEEKFYNLMVSEVLSKEVQGSISNGMKEYKADTSLYELCCKVRPLLY